MKAPCNHPGCHALVKGGGYCEEHKRDKNEAGRQYDQRRKNDPKLAQAAKLRNTARWRKVRLLKLSCNPLCEDPFSDHARTNHTQPAQQVHHIQGLVKRPDLAYELGNLQSVCTRCHAKLEAKERAQG